MKNFVLSELLLVSFVEKTAKRIEFDPRRTTIVGRNDTGKSALLKSIYWTFGAKPIETHPKWDAANVATLARFEIDGQRYGMLRQGDVLALLDGSDDVLGCYTSVTRELAPALARLLEFGMVIPDRAGNVITPPPAFYFLPFYLDQDRSWTDNWSGFASLQQLPDYRRLMAEYHSGIRPNEYYQANAELTQLRRSQQEAQAELRAVRAARSTFDDRLPFDGFNLDPTAFAEDIERLISEAEKLAQEEQRYRVQLQELRGQLAAVSAQAELVQYEMSELRADAKFANALSHEVECPTCGTIHQNSFLERFAIARDEDRCLDLKQRLDEDRRELEGKIDSARKEFDSVAQRRTKVDEVLSTRRGELQLRDLIESRGRAQVQEIFRDTVTKYAEQGRSLEDRIRALEATVRRLTDKRRKSEIVEFYRARMREFLLELDVLNLDPRSYQAIAAKIREIGSDKPRALLAYYFSFLYTMRRFGSSVFCPLVIDEPNQQGLDPASLPRVLQFIFEHQPDDSQLILGVEDLHGVRAGGQVVELTEKWQLLGSLEFEAVAATVRPLLQNAFRLTAQ